MLRVLEALITTLVLEITTSHHPVNGDRSEEGRYQRRHQVLPNLAQHECMLSGGAARRAARTRAARRAEPGP